jgi:hypothetical protein
MAYQLSFSRALEYDAGQPGITLPVTLNLGQLKVDCEAKLDTGASLCIFAREYGEQLGLQIAEGIRQVVGTVTGSFVVYLHEINLSVAGMEFDALAGFAEDSGLRRSVLGRRGFLERVSLGLVDYEGKLYLSYYNTE